MINPWPGGLRKTIVMLTVMLTMAIMTTLGFCAKSAWKLVRVSVCFYICVCANDVICTSIFVNLIYLILWYNHFKTDI